MATTDRLTQVLHPDWFKSSYSNASGSCVEVLFTNGPTLVRDSKDRQMTTPVIQVEQNAWTCFVRDLTTKAA
ncbi:DUF397 domain-containing protein [Amycolatopsis sp. NBC_01488]|uniref:DUF397 domain-containing protein n=1 Tax=Amycolatopsis sp. NBC_01488 TaxID=2903563 RepID=UPI002E2B5968|nr:DUF397 domain-containing protein [Amycolatopsis sp. NBC_01488]